MAHSLILWLIFSLALFAIGLYGFLTRRSAVGLLIAIELMLNAATVQFVVLGRRFHFADAANSLAAGSSNEKMIEGLIVSGLDGQIMAIFAMALAAAEVMIGLAILVMLFRELRTVDLNKINHLRH